MKLKVEKHFLTQREEVFFKPVHKREGVVQPLQPSEYPLRFTGLTVGRMVRSHQGLHGWSLDIPGVDGLLQP